MDIEKIKFVTINVESNVQRYQHMQDQADKCHIPLTFFKAITPEAISTVPHCYDPRKAQMWWRRKLIPTEIACGLSHISLWRSFLQDTAHDYLVIFEDDVHIDTDFMSVIQNISQLPQQYEFIKLSGQIERPKRHIADLTDKHKLFLNAYGTLDAGCYMLNKAGAKKLLDYCVSLHMGIDILMDRSFSHGVDYHTVEPYPVQTFWVTEGKLKSQIGVQERMLRYDHKNICYKIIFKLLRIYTSIQRKIAILSLFMRRVS